MSIRESHLNNLTVLKGRIGNNKFPIWDAVGPCMETCGLRETCTYDKSARKCKLQVMYLRTVLDIVLENLPNKESPSEYVLTKVGLMLMPLFKQLITMKILEHALTDPEIGEDGKVKIHPVYKEIRVIIKDIDNVLKELGMNRVQAAPAVGFNPFEDAMPNMDGSAGYYENMQKVHETKRDNRKLKQKISVRRPI